MAYADQEMSTSRMVTIGLVALLHAGVGYALVTGLAVDAYEKAKKKITAVDVKLDEPEEEPPPPPPPPPSKAIQKGGSISDEDYPSSSIRNEEAGTAVARFTIGPDGKVTDCSASGASPTLDAETCKLIMRRFRFKPAMSNGTPVAESRSQRVTWRLPK
jgi:periplasmic protein TonB